MIASVILGFLIAAVIVAAIIRISDTLDDWYDDE